MRIATWNVNSLKARLEKVEWWLERAAPDVLLLQETKLADGAAPVMAFEMAGYTLVHHGEGRWNGVAIASRMGAAGVVTNFGDGPVRSSAAGAEVGSGEEDFDPFDEARMVSAVCGGVRVVSLYAPNGRALGTPFYAGKLDWFARVGRWLDETQDPTMPLVLGGDLNVAPADADVWDPEGTHGSTHVSGPERDAFEALLAWGLTDVYRSRHHEPGRYTWWDYRAGNFQRNEGMRIDHLLATAPVATRVVAVEIDREARKGKPLPSDHAPLVMDIDEPGRPFDPGWAGSVERFAARRAAQRG
ncbi:MAG: exodeoxyribonuclease III [Chloroflexota bacterium]